ncbi:MAG: DNA polymerase III subunit delta [Clostridia bacterium]
MANEKSAWKKLKCDIDSGNTAKLYLFYGEESYLREYYTEQLKKALVYDSMPEFNLVELSGKVSIDTIIEAVDSYPIMSEKKLVIIRDFDIFKADDAFKTRLISVLSDLPEHCCLLIIYGNDFKPDKRTKLFTAISKNGEVIDYTRAERHDIGAWIKRRFRALGHDISPELTDYLIFYCGGLMQPLIPEIEKISAYTRRSEIRREDITAVATPNTEAVVFDLTDAIGAKEYKKAIGIAEQLNTLGEAPFALIALIGRQMRQIYSACLLMREGRDARALMGMWGMRSDYPAKIIMRIARGVGLSWARFAVNLCTEIDAELKLGAKSDILQYFIARLAAFQEVKS